MADGPARSVSERHLAAGFALGPQKVQSSYAQSDHMQILSDCEHRARVGLTAVVGNQLQGGISYPKVSRAFSIRYRNAT